MAYTSKFKGEEIDALLDKVQSEDSNAIPIVESVDELDVTSPVGTVAVVAKQGSRKITSFKDLIQPTQSIIDDTGVLNTDGLSLVKDVEVAPPDNVLSFPPLTNTPNELRLNFVSSNPNINSTPETLLTLVIYVESNNQIQVNFEFMDSSSGINDNYLIFQGDTTTNISINEEGVTKLKDYFKNNDLYYISDIDKLLQDITIEDEWWPFLDSFIKPVYITLTKASLYLKKEEWSDLGIPEYTSYESLLDSNPKLGQISSVISSTEVEKSWMDLYVPSVQEVTANSSGKMVGRALFDRVYSLRDVGLSSLVGMTYLEVAQQIEPKSVFLRERNALNNGTFFIFAGFALASFGGVSFSFVQLNNMSTEEFNSSGISPEDAVVTGIDYEQLDKCNAFLKENDIVFLETMGTGLSSDENLQTLSDLVSPNILVESNNLYVNTEYGILPLFKNDIVDSFRDTVRILQKVPFYNEEDSHTFVECLIPGGISSWVQSSKRDVELHCGSFGENPIEIFTFYLYNVNSLTVWRVTENTTDISSEVHWDIALPESFDANCMYKVTITFVYANGLTDNKYVMGTYTKF